jgi:site-specific DNA recombinase
MLRRAAIYIRVSTDQQAREGESIPAQRQRLRDWAHAHGYQVVAEYCDAGESARAADRPEFVRMLKDARSGDREFDTILVWKWDRFARNVDDATIYKGLLRRQLGVDLKAVGDPESEGAVGVLLERILDVVAEFQSLVTAEHVKNTMSFLASNGRWLGKVPFGYRLGETGLLAVEPQEAQAVRWAFSAFARGSESITGIAERFASGDPFPVTLHRGYKWSPQAVRVMLSNRVYTGAVIWNRRRTVIESMAGMSRRSTRRRDEGEWVVVEGAHEPLVDEATFEAVQSALEQNRIRRRKARSYGDYLFRGLLICGRCGHSMVLHAPDNGMLPRLACSAYFRMPAVACRPMNYIRRTELVEAVNAALDAILAGEVPPNLELVGDQDGRVRHERRLNALSDRLSRLMDAYEAGAITLAEFKARREAIDRERGVVEEAMRTEEEGVDRAALLAGLQRAAERVRDLLADTQATSVGVANSVLRQVIHSITVDRERGLVDIRWRAFTNPS